MTAPAGEEDADDVLDGEDADVTSESETDGDSQNTDGSGSDQPERKKNSSNWKKMSEALKQERREKEELKAELEKVKSWADSLYEDEDKKPFAKKESVPDASESKLEEKIFLIENKDAKDHLEDIRAVKKKF